MKPTIIRAAKIDEDYKNSVVTVSINEGIAKISRTDSAKVSGYFRWDTKRFGDDYLASDVEILDVGTTNKRPVLI